MSVIFHIHGRQPPELKDIPKGAWAECVKGLWFINELFEHFALRRRRERMH
jgi:hypothetical protein